MKLGTLPTTQVSKIESFTVRQDIEAGGHDPAAVEFPNLVVTLLESAAWTSFFQDFVINGNHADSSELAGKIEILTADRAKVLAEIGLGHVGIVSLEPVHAYPSTAKTVRAELYCEQMTFRFKPTG